jgi:ArsR family transcriptional regulator
MAANVLRASDFLKTLAHPHRLLILCHLAEGERSVGELERLLKLRQPTLSQQLARLREDGLVETRRTGKMIH